MRRLLALFLIAAFTAAMALAAVAGVAWATPRIAAIQNPAVRAAATLLEVAIGVLWLLGAVYVATRLSVLVFAQNESENGG
jgi:hypothetical protein